jgi:hypothetical protein
MYHKIDLSVKKYGKMVETEEAGSGQEVLNDPGKLIGENFAVFHGVLRRHKWIRNCRAYRSKVYLKIFGSFFQVAPVGRLGSKFRPERFFSELSPGKNLKAPTGRIIVPPTGFTPD